MKLCKGECNETLPLTEFRLKSGGNGKKYPNSRCRLCEKRYNAEYVIRRECYFSQLAPLPGWMQ